MIPALKAGDVLGGDFRILTRLGSGGMGVVYLVDQISTGRRRALKVMKEHLIDDPDMRRRFAREARVSGQIDSEHVVEVIGTGVDETTGRMWIAMEFLRGEDLARRISRAGPLSLPDAVSVLRQICHCLDAAHAAGVVHRDLKPENVFLANSRRADVDYTAKVLDFGIAKALWDTTQTVGGGIGTPQYMAPEQFSASKVTTATDVWALALVAFYVLTGHHYLRHADVPASWADALRKEVVEGELPLASARASELGATLPTGFDWWFQRCVVRDPRSRFATAGIAFEQLGAALGKFADRSGDERRRTEQRATAQSLPEPVAPRPAGVVPLTPGEEPLPRSLPRRATSNWRLSGVLLLVVAVLIYLFLATIGQLLAVR